MSTCESKVDTLLFFENIFIILCNLIGSNHTQKYQYRYFARTRSRVLFQTFKALNYFDVVIFCSNTITIGIIFYIEKTCSHVCTSKYCRKWKKHSNCSKRVIFYSIIWLYLHVIFLDSITLLFIRPFSTVEIPNKLTSELQLEL